MPTALITGSNRGLGLEWTHQLAAAGWRVHATCRLPDEAHDLHRLAAAYPRLSVHRLDVTHGDDIAALSRELHDSAIDWLINNAGVYFERWDKDPLGSIEYDAWEETFRVNTLGAVRVTEALTEQLARSEHKLVLTITSHMGSIAEIGSGRSYAYRSSKAALNAAMKGIALELKPRDIGVLLLHPGWVNTRMGGPDAPYTAEESVRGMRRRADGFRPEHSGRFFRFDGSEIPW
jgi:NAD(P)-dependent dehydrogenase (short-subunit alcohol dehydrogenase family)